MEQQREKIYVGNGAEKFDGDVVEFALNLSNLKPSMEEFVYEYNGQKFINLKVCKNKNGVSQWGKTHSVQVNTFKPDQKQETAPAPVPAPVAAVAGFDDDIPF
jgi:hypothetical protein